MKNKFYWYRPETIHSFNITRLETQKQGLAYLDIVWYLLKTSSRTTFRFYISSPQQENCGKIEWKVFFLICTFVTGQKMQHIS